MRKEIPKERSCGTTSANARLHTAAILANLQISTVCDAAMCPNRHECYARRTATFLLLGTRCTRNCPFCGVKGSDAPLNPPDPTEPRRVADAVATLDLRHVVLTCVTRDDRPDGGAAHFVQTIRAIRTLPNAVSIEVLPSDFAGNADAIETLAREKPEIYAYNTETVPRRFAAVRDRRATYQRTLRVFEIVHRVSPQIPLKTGLMVGVGETIPELLEVWSDLLRRGVSRLTVGQYLRPGRGNLPVYRYYSPGEFAYLERLAKTMGFRYVMAGRLVRSSYHAEEMVKNEE